MILSHVTKQYRTVRALDDLSLTIEEGKITAVLGESGAGKTTLLSCIMGLIPFEGEIDGEGGKRPKRREDCSYLFQDALLLPNLTAEENIDLVLPKGMGEKTREMLARVGLKGKEKAYPHELSGGEKQRVSIARAFLYPHKLLLMDEPFSSLDLSLSGACARTAPGEAHRRSCDRRALPARSALSAARGKRACPHPFRDG